MVNEFSSSFQCTYSTSVVSTIKQSSGISIYNTFASSKQQMQNSAKWISTADGKIYTISLGGLVGRG